MDMERNRSHRKKTLILVLLAFATGHCLRDGAPELAMKYGPAFNSVRKELGITILPDNWIRLNHYKTESLNWKNPQGDRLSDEKKPHHFLKVMVFKNQEPELEQDNFYSGREFEHMDGTGFEKIWVTYHHDRKRKGENPWKCTLETGVPSGYDDPRYPIRFTGEPISLEVAQRMLIQWGLHYP